MSNIAHTVWRNPRRARLAVACIVFLIVAFALVWIGRASADDGDPGSPDAVSTSVSNVATGKADAVDASDSQCTTSTAFADMPSMSEMFSFGGNPSRPVLVLFQGLWLNFPEGEAVIRLLIDGVIQPSPGAGLTVHEDDAAQDGETNGFNFISVPLTPGAHTAKIQWRSAIGGQICVSGRSLIILHK